MKKMTLLEGQGKQILVLLVVLYTLILPVSASWTSDLNSNIISYYKLDNNNMNDSLNTYNLGTNNGTINTTGKILDARYFNKSKAQYIEYPIPAFQNNSNFSVSLWLNASRVDAGTILSSGKGPGAFTFVLYLSGAGTLNYYTQKNAIGETIIISAGDVDVNVYSHIVLTYQSNKTMELWVNGVRVGTATATSTTSTLGSAGFLFGGYYNAGGIDLTGTYNGTMDEIGVWNRTLNGSQISNLYNSGVGITYTDLESPTILVTGGNGTNNFGILNQNHTINFSIVDTHLDKCWYGQNLNNYYQESANTTNQTGIDGINLNYTGSFSSVGVIGYNECNDGIWKQSPFVTSFCDIGIADYLIITYKKPSLSTFNATWNITSYLGSPLVYDEKSFYLPNDCLIFGDNVTLKVLGTPGYTNYYCNSGLGYIYLGNSTSSQMNEEGLTWYLGNKTMLNCSVPNLNLTIRSASDNLTLYANDTYGNIANKYVDWNFKVIQNNETYLNQTIEGAINTFTLNLSLQSGLNLEEVNLVYNGTNYNANAFLVGNNYIISRNIAIPGIITTTNYSFYWNIRLSDSTLINTSSHNQTVYNLSVDNCTLYSYGIYTFNLLDEETQVALTGATTIDVAMNIYSSDRSSNILSFNKSYNQTNPARICLGSALLNQTNFSVDILIRYERNDSHSIEYYNIVNDTLSNSSTLQIINLYDLLLIDTTEFRLTFIDADFVPRENALVYLMRQYVSENTFKTVELPKTDSNGQTILHMVRNDVIYNIVIVDSVTKQVLGTFTNIIAFCEDISIGKCEINLNAFSTETEIYDYDDALGIIVSNPNYDNTTRIISFDFVTTSGTAKTVRMVVTRNDIFGNNTVCDTSLISAGGTLTCNVPSTIDDTLLIVSIYVDGVLVSYANVQMDKTNLGYIGYIALFFMMISLVLMFSSSKEGVLIGLGLGVLAGIGLGLITGTVLGLGSVGIWIIILILLAFWKLNQGRNS